MIQCGKYAPQTSHKAHAKQRVVFSVHNSIDGYMCLMNTKTERKNSCIWNWLVGWLVCALFQPPRIER